MSKASWTRVTAAAVIIVPMGLLNATRGAAMVRPHAPLANVIQVASGLYHACALRSNGAVYCWGRNDSGQLGHTANSSSNPAPWLVRFSGTGAGGALNKIVQITAGDNFTCALRNTGAIGYEVWCWGSNRGDALGYAGGSSPRPRLVTAAGNGSGQPLEVGEIAAGREHVCAVDVNPTVFCWGLNSNGQLGQGSVSAAPSDVPLSVSLPKVTQIAAGGDEACATDSPSQVYCWGRDNFGQVGPVPAGTPQAVSSPMLVPMPGNAVVSQIAVGRNHACVILPSKQRMYCWGDNAYGELGRGTYTAGRNPMPRAVILNTLLIPQTLSAGGYHTCVATYVTFCWGLDNHMQIGDGRSNWPTETNAPSSTAFAGIYSQMSGGGFHTCGVTATSRVECWGWNNWGQLGPLGATYSGKPVIV